MAFAVPLVGAALAGGGTAAAGGSLATALAVGSSAISGLSAIQSANYQSAVARQNAAIAERNAQVASEKSQVEQLQSDREAAQLLGQQEAIQAASGLNLMSRSALEVRRNTRRVGQEQARNIIDEGTGRARGYLQDSADFRGQARQAQTEGFFSAAGSALNAATSIYGDRNLRRSILGSSRATRKSFGSGGATGGW